MQRKGFVFCLTYLSFLLKIVAQQSYVDSLRQEFALEKDPFKRIDIFYDIGNELALDNPELGFAYADSLEFMSKKVSYKKGLAMAFHLRGHAFDDQGQYEQALQLFEEELKIFRELNDRKEQSTAYTNLGSVWSNLGRSDSAIAYYLRSLEIDEALGEKLGASINHNNIGNLYSDDGVYDKAIEHFEKALKLRQELGLEKRYIQSYSNLSTVYSRKKDYQKAMEYAQKGLDLAIKYDNKSWAAIIANSIGNDFVDQGRHAEAIPWLEKSRDWFRAINNEVNETYPLYNMSMAYSNLGDGDRALQYAREGYEIVERLELDWQNELYFKAFAKAHEAKGDYRQAYAWFQKYVTIADSIFKLDNTKKVAQIEAQFETQKKEAQLARQQLEIERQSDLKNRIIIGATALLIIVLGIFQFQRSRLRHRRKEAELTARLEHAEAEKFREMNEVKSTFFANISHEFRTPLTLIISPLEQLLAGTFRGDAQKYYRIMLQNGKRLLDLVNQLLDLSKLESGKLALRASEGDLGKFISAIAWSFESLAVRQQIKLEVESTTRPMTCFFDPDKVEKIVSNLMSNAFKFTGEGGTVSVSLSASYTQSGAPDEARLIVQDTGIGIPAEALPHLFDRFYYSTASEIQAGSGLGLALTKELVELHGGRITVESAEEKGTTFTVTLRVGLSFFKAGEISEIQEDFLSQKTDFEPNTETASVPAEVRKPLAELLTKSEKPAILISEDNEDVRSYIAEQLDGKYKIIEAENGRTGFQKAIEQTPDLIITDIMMPEMDGTQLCKLLKTNEKTSHIPVIMLTARADQADKLEGLETGADDYLVKPFDTKELLVRIANLLEQRRKLQDHYRRTLVALTPDALHMESMDSTFLQRIRQVVEANLDDENFSVVELGTQIGMSRSQLHRKCAALTGFAPNEIIRNMRLERARQLLESKSGNASEVAYLCGFSSPGYFSKCFKDYFGKLPSEV